MISFLRGPKFLRTILFCSGCLLLFVSTFLCWKNTGTTAEPDVPKGGVIVLDDCDPEFKGQETYDDNLSFIDSAGKLALRVGGLNNCQSIGSSHKIAVDSTRGWIWVLEEAGKRIRKVDREGKELLALKETEANALAVDPETGNLWVLTSVGIIYGDKTAVFDSDGKKLATFDFSGFDIAFDPKSKAFWIVAKKLTKVSAQDKVVVATVDDIAGWCSSSVAVHPDSGNVYVAVREHGQMGPSSNELRSFDSDGRPNWTVALGEKSPMHVSIDPNDETVWVALLRRSVQRYSPDGKLESEFPCHALAVEADAATGGAWVVTDEGILNLSRKGESRLLVKHKAKTLQAWIARF